MKTNTNPAPDSENLPDGSRLKTRRLILISLIIFLVALGVRLLTWQDARLLEAVKVQSAVTAD